MENGNYVILLWFAACIFPLYNSKNQKTYGNPAIKRLTNLPLNDKRI